jgi:hypothetical protein
LQSARGLHGEVVLRAREQVAVAKDLAVVPPFEVEPVGEVDQLEDGLQRVIAVLSTTGHVQEEVQLGGGGQAEGALHPLMLTVGCFPARGRNPSAQDFRS